MKKLTLNKETIRVLNDAASAMVAAGIDTLDCETAKLTLCQCPDPKNTIHICHVNTSGGGFC